MIDALFSSQVVTEATTATIDLEQLPAAERAAVAEAPLKRQREFAAGRLCARRALTRLGIADHLLLVGDDGLPRWPAEVVGSISHCSGFCGVALARGSALLGLGLDVERLGPLSPAATAAVCTLEELDRTPGTTEGDRAKLIFAAKEAFYKCYYPLARTYLDFQDVAIELSDTGAFVGHLCRSDLPAAAGRRSLPGRLIIDAQRVYCGVALPSPASSARDCGIARRPR